MQEEPMIDKIEYADAIKLEKPEPDESDIDHRRHDRFQFWNFIKKPGFIAWVIILIVLFMVTFLSSGKKDPSKADFNTVMNRLDRIEARLHDLEGMQERMTAEVRAQKNTVGKDLTATTDADKTTAQKIDLLTKKVELLQQKTDSAVKEPRADRNVAAQRVEANRPKYHVVARGETLYRIAMKYGLTVDALRNLNRMSPDQSIHPGQKLMVTAAKGS